MAVSTGSKTVRASGLKEGMFIQWPTEWRREFEITKVEQIGSWVFVTMKDHPTGVCTIWNSLELPYHT